MRRAIVVFALLTLAGCVRGSPAEPEVTCVDVYWQAVHAGTSPDAVACIKVWR